MQESGDRINEKLKLLNKEIGEKNYDSMKIH